MIYWVWMITYHKEQGCFTVMTQFCFIKVILLQFTYAYGGKYIVFWVAGLNVIISDIRSKASYMRHVNML